MATPSPCVVRCFHCANDAQFVCSISRVVLCATHAAVASKAFRLTLSPQNYPHSGANSPLPHGAHCGEGGGMQDGDDNNLRTARGSFKGVNFGQFAALVTDSITPSPPCIGTRGSGGAIALPMSPTQCVADAMNQGQSRAYFTGNVIQITRSVLTKKHPMIERTMKHTIEHYIYVEFGHGTAGLGGTTRRPGQSVTMCPGSWLAIPLGVPFQVEKSKATPVMSLVIVYARQSHGTVFPLEQEATPLYITRKPSSSGGGGSTKKDKKKKRGSYLRRRKAADNE